MKTKSGPESQKSAPPKPRIHGDPMDLDDLLLLADVDEIDMAQALVWLEQVAPEEYRDKLSGIGD